MTSVGLIYDQMNLDVQTQIVRDLLVLAGDFKFDVFDQQQQFDTNLLKQLELKSTEIPPSLYIVYKTGETWPKSPAGITTVQRDMCPPQEKMSLDPNPKIGYYLNPQGRDGANLTERYLNRSYPRGNGVVNPLITLLWG